MFINYCSTPFKRSIYVVKIKNVKDRYDYYSHFTNTEIKV